MTALLPAAEDTLLRQCVRNLAATWVAPVAAMGGRVLRDPAFDAADLGRPAGYWNGATLLRPLDGDGDDVLGRIEAFLGGGTGDVMLWSPWPTPDLGSRGWRLEGLPPLMVRPAGRAPEPRPVPGLRIEVVTDAAGIRDFERVAVDGYPFPQLQPLVSGSLFDLRVLSDARLRMWVGYERGSRGRDVPVVIGSLVVDSGVAGFMLGVTAPHARHRGYWAAMARHRLAAVPDLPAAGLFSDMSRPGAERLLGFRELTRFTLWSRPRPPRS